MHPPLIHHIISFFLYFYIQFFRLSFLPSLFIFHFPISFSYYPLPILSCFLSSYFLFFSAFFPFFLYNLLYFHSFIHSFIFFFLNLYSLLPAFLSSYLPFFLLPLTIFLHRLSIRYSFPSDWTRVFAPIVIFFANSPKWLELVGAVWILAETKVAVCSWVDWPKRWGGGAS